MANKWNNHRLLPFLHPVILILALFFVFTTNIRSQNITEVEYFFNTDPGYGAGTILPVNPPAPDIGNFNFDVSISGLNDGFHKLFVRAKDDNGIWSLSNSRSFYKNTLMAGFLNLTKLEYFFDSDPGPGNGTDVPITTGPTIDDLEFSIDITGLEEGFHQLYVRTMDHNGVWSLTNRRQFIKEVVNVSNPSVIAAEYFFDSDPGPGLATPIGVSPGGNDVTLDFNIDISSLPEGFHNLFVRVRDNEGSWSLSSRRSFVIEQINVVNPLITAIEYFFDADPGFGQGEPVPFTPSGNVTVSDHVIDIDALPAGFHKLYIRAKDNSGNWSLTNIRSFVKQGLTTTVPDLIAAEYFFDNDPGFGEGTEISIPSGQNEIDVSFIADISSLAAGFHKLFVRVKDADLGWSLTNIRPFYKTAELPQASDIVYAEYFFNTDPGFGNGTIIPVPNPSTHVQDLVFEVDPTGLQTGNHMFFVRIKDESGHWSLTLADEYCSSPLADFSADDVWLGEETTFTNLSLYTDETTIYQWDVNGDNITDYTYDHGFTHTYPAQGTYNAKLVLTTLEGCQDAVTKPVSVFTCTPPKWLYVSDTTWNSAIIHWTAANIETAWNIEYGVSGFTPGNGILISDVSANSYQLNNLDPASDYDFYVQSACYPGTNSFWAGPVSFTTLIQYCETPVNLLATNISFDEATLTWESPGQEISWNIEYGLQGFVQGNGTLISDVTDTVYVLSGLDQETAYDFYVQSVCSPSLSSTWAGPATFTTSFQNLETGLWGMTSNGGDSDAGVMFGYDPDIQYYLKIHDFDGTNGSFPFGSLVMAANGKLYGMTSQGGASNYGVLFEYDPVTRTYTNKLNFDGTNGKNPYGNLIEASNGKLYGMTYDGGLGIGVIFEYDPVTQAYAKKFEFSGSNGGHPYGSLLQASNGKLYGMTYQGGTNGYGSLFEYDPVSEVYALKASFVLTNGANPRGNLVQAPNGKLYGMTQSGGTDFLGNLFEFDPLTGNLTNKIDFNYVNGGYPSGDLLLADNGKFYGLTRIGGTNHFGILFEYDYVTNNLIVKFEFDGTNLGSNPEGTLVQASNGNLYGMTYSGGTDDYGVLFEFNPETGICSKKLDFTGNNGKYPRISQLLNIGIQCNNPTNGGEIAFSQTICFGTYPDTLNSINPASGHTGTLEYKWQSSTDNAIFSDIPGAVSEDYIPPVLTVTTWFRRLAKVTCESDWNGAAISNLVEITVGNREQYRTIASGDWSNTAIWEKYNGSTWVTADHYPSADLITCPNPVAVIQPGDTITVSSGISFGNIIVHENAILEIEDDADLGIITGDTLTVHGTIITHSTAIVSGAGHFVLSTGAEIHIGSAEGISVGTATGNIRVTGSRWYASGANYVYIGTGNQITGDGLMQNTPHHLTINAPGMVVTLSQAISVTGNIHILNGTLDVNNFDIALNGSWINNGIFIPGTATVYFNATVNVFISVSNFYNVVFAGTDTITAGGELTIYGNVVINNYFNAGSYNVYVYGNWTNNGVFIYGTSTVYFVGSGNVYIGAGNFYNVIFGGTGTITATGALTFYGSVTINNYFNAGTYTHYVYGNWTNSGTFVYNTSTIQFMGTSNIYIGATNFYNVIFAGSGTVVATGEIIFYGNITINNYFDAGSFTHYVYGNWINNAVFVSGSSTINFTGTNNIYIGASNFYNIIFTGTGIIQATGSLTITGNMTINTYFDAGSYTHVVSGDWTNNGTFIYNNSTIEFTGNDNVLISGNDFYNVIFGGTGTFTATGSINFYGDVTINNYFDAGSYTHYVYGNWVNNGTFVYGTSTLIFSGTTNITIGVGSFYNVIFGGTGNITATGSLTIYGDITIENYFDAGSYEHFVYGNWINNGVFIYGTSTINFVGTTNLYLGGYTFYNIIFGGTGTVVATGSLTIYGDITINNYFDAGSYTHYIYGNWINSGTFVYGTSTIQFIGSGNITIGISNFYHIVFGGSGTITATGSLTIWGDVTINNYFDAGSFTHYIYGNWINNGTFVYGTSTIYFEATVNIYISVNEFYNVVFAGSGNYVATGSITFYGNVTINNYFDAGSYVHYVYGNWTNNGTFVYGTSTIWFMGTTNVFIGTGNFYHIVFGGSGMVTASGSLTIYGDITINNYFDGGSYVHYIYGNWINNGVFVYNTSTINFVGTGNITIGNSEFYHILFGGTGTIVATGSLTIWGDITINNYFDAGSYEHFIYGNWINNGVFVYGTSTIHFSGSINLYISETEFYHVIFGGTGTIMATGPMIFHGDVTINNYFDAGNFTHYVYGNWTNNGTFIYGTSTIHFAGAGTIHIGQSSFYHIIFGGTGNIIATGSLTIFGDVTINNYFDAGSFTHYIYGNWINNGTFVYGTSTIHFSATINIFIGQNEFYHVIFGGTGNYVATGPIIFHGDVTINNYFDAGNFTHIVHGSWINNGTFVYGTSTIHFMGSGTAYVGGGNFWHVIFGGTGTVTASGSLYIYGNITINNHFDGGSYVHYIYGNWINNGVFAYNTSTVHFAGNTGISIGSSEFYHIIFGGSGTIVATGSLTIWGDVTINNYFDAGSYVHYVYGNWYNNGVFVYGTSTIHFSGSINISISQNEFYHVIFGGTGTITATGPIIFHGDVTINNHFNAGNFAHYVYGNWINTGTFVYGTSTIHFVGTTDRNIGESSFWHIVLGGSGTITATGSLTIYGDITINNHFDGASYVHYIYGNWINNGIFVYGTSTIHFMGTINRFISESEFYSVIFGGTGTITAAGALTIYGDLTVQNHFHAGSYTHRLRKGWINNGNFEHGTSTIVFDGDEQQLIEGSSEPVFYAFEVNNPQGILLNVNVSVYFNLILTQGIITTENYLYTIMPYGNITGGSASAYIHGKLVCGYHTLGSRMFPVGTAALYGPMTFNYVTLTGTSMVQVEFVEGTVPGNIPGYYNSVAGHYWIISQTGGTSFTFTVTLNVTGYNPLGSVWILNSDGVNVMGWPTTAPNYTNITVFNTFGYFTIGDQFCPVPGGLINRYVTNTTAILDWQAGFAEQSWNVEYGPEGFTPGTGILLTGVSEKPLEITGLSPETYYEFYVQSVCSEEIQSDWIGPEPFSTFPKQLDATVFLEGPYNEATGLMGTGLSDNGFIPLTQPYNAAPWNYPGDETVTVVPQDVVDWVLIEWRQAVSPGLAVGSTWIWRKAAFLKADGSIVDLNGSSLPWIGNPQLSGNLYVVVRHRNHVDVMASYGAVLIGEIFSYDFSDQAGKMFGGSNAYKQIGTSPDRFGMAAGDGNADGQVVQLSDVPAWSSSAGEKGYYPGDYNMDGQVQNQDKNDVMYPNRGKASAIP